MRPPGRGFHSVTELVKPRGPHHFATCAGSVQACQTSARGALKVRAIFTSRSRAIAQVLFVVVLLALREELREAVDHPVPARAVPVASLRRREDTLLQGQPRFAGYDFLEGHGHQGLCAAYADVGFPGEGEGQNLGRLDLAIDAALRELLSLPAHHIAPDAADPKVRP